MAYQASESDGDTVPLTPESFKQHVTDVDEDEVFAWLRPHGKAACAAFDSSVNSTIKNNLRHRYEHERKFLHRISRERRASSFFTEDGEEVDRCGSYQWSGAFKLSLKTPPRDAAEGWFLGTNYGRDTQEVDILLAPPKESKATGIAGKHARLFFHDESCRMVLEARHAVTLAKNGAEVITQSQHRVIEDGELIQIGTCSYIFEYTSFHRTKAFEEVLFWWIKEHGNRQEMPNELLSPSSVVESRSLGNYYCSARAFAKGTFGKISAGWARDGSAVAIKVLKEPDKSRVEYHQRIMNEIGYHVRHTMLSM